MKGFSKLLLFFVFISSCSVIKPLSKSEQFSKGFKENIFKVKGLLRIKKYQEAKNILLSQKDASLSEIEKAEKYNTLGLIEYSEGNYSRAKARFNKAMSFDFSEPQLVNQVMLNVASTDFKLSKYDDSLDQIKQIDVEKLSESDRRKAFILSFLNAKKLNRSDDEMLALVNLLAPVRKDELVDNKYFKILSKKFNEADVDKLKSIYDFHSEVNAPVVGKLAYNHSMTLFKNGKNIEGEKLKQWLISNYEDYESEYTGEALNLVRDVHDSISLTKIGVILPLSGKKAKFGANVLNGLSLALKTQSNYNFELVVRDSQNSANIAGKSTQELIQKENVALIIGGLYSHTALRAYEESSKLGAAFLSLAPIYTDRAHKDELLFEVPGSVESQINAAISRKSLKELGNRVAIFYPENKVGRTYLDEFWNLSQLNQYQLVTVNGFEEKTIDFREHIKNMVGLKFPREREEEFSLWEGIYKAKYKNIDRIQILKPVVDFDWVFIPSFPQQAVQIIPSFQYLGVKKVPFVGGPSWRSRTMISRQKMLGAVYCISDLEKVNKNKFRALYKNAYNAEPRLLETLGFDAVYLAKSILKGPLSSGLSSRGDLITKLKESNSQEAFLGKWSKQGDLWIKEMTLGRLTETGVKSI